MTIHGSASGANAGANALRVVANATTAAARTATRFKGLTTVRRSAPAAVGRRTTHCSIWDVSGSVVTHAP